eukprot:253924_1
MTMTRPLKAHKILNSNLNKLHGYRNGMYLIPRTHLFTWSKEHLIDPIYGIAQHTIQNPTQFGVAIACVGLATVGLRKLSRRVMYIPHTEFWPSWQSNLQNIDYENIYFKNSDNIELHGWYIKGHNPQLSQYPLLFLHGNAGNISHRIDNLMLLHRNIGCDIFIFDYRGYGKSSKALKPTQDGLIDDALSALKQLIQIKNGHAIKPIIFGRSIGAAVAFHTMTLIKQNNIQIGGLVIENTFTTVCDVVSNNFLYPFIVDKWNNVECVKKIKQQHLEDTPILFISASKDTMLDPEMMKTLHDHCQIEYEFSNVHWKEFADADHNDTFLSDGYTDAIQSFMESVKNNTQQ